MTTELTVLVVDDERSVADTYAGLLADRYDVAVAYDGRAALATLDERDVDVVLLDRQMPGLDGDETLVRIRDRGVDCRVAMVTAVEPDFDIVEMPFDEYVTKPLSRADLVAVVERLADRRAYAADVQRRYALATKVAVLEAEKTRAELADSERYAALRTRLEALEAKLAADAPPPDDVRAWTALFEEVTRHREAD